VGNAADSLRAIQSSGEEHFLPAFSELIFASK
jgi:hypothetical protein